MSLYRNSTTGFVGLYPNGAPGGDWVALDPSPGAPIYAATEWWRKLDQNVVTLVDWHPSLYEELILPPKPSGLAGSGVNIFPALYASYETQEGLPVMASDGVDYELMSGGFHGSWKLRLTATKDNATVFFAKATDDYNIKVTPFRRWITSAYFSSPNSLTPFTWIINLTDANGGGLEADEYSSATSETGGEWTRLWTGMGNSDLIDWSQVDKVRANMGVRLTNNGDILDIDAIMLEELLGDTVEPSAYADPPYTPKTTNDIIVNTNIEATNSEGSAATTTYSLAAGSTAICYSFTRPEITEENVERGSILMNGVVTLRKASPSDGYAMKGTVAYWRNESELVRRNFTLPAIKYGTLPLNYSDFERLTENCSYVIKITNTGNSAFVIEGIDAWWVELKL